MKSRMCVSRVVTFRHGVMFGSASADHNIFRQEIRPVYSIGSGVEENIPYGLTLPLFASIPSMPTACFGGADLSSAEMGIATYSAGTRENSADV
jgi:hypothetical protein